MGVFFHIGAVGDHNAHGKGHRIKQLPHGRQDRGCGKFAEIRFQVVDYAVHGSGQGEAIDGNAQGKEYQQRHHDLADLFHAFFHAGHDDDHGDGYENDEPHHGRGGRNEFGEIIAVGQGRTAAGPVDEQIFDDPSADYTVIGSDDDGHQGCQRPQETEPFIKDAVGMDGALPGFPSDGDLRHHQGKTEGDGQDQVNQEEDPSPVLGGQVGETPDVPESYRRTGSGQDESQLSGETASFCRLFHTFPSKIVISL